VYEEIDARISVDILSLGHKEKLYTKETARGVKVAQLLEEGKTPQEIRAELGLSRIQYCRAIKRHEQNSGVPILGLPLIQHPARDRKVRTAVRHLLKTGTFKPGHVLQLTTYFHFGRRDTVDEIVREERHRLALDGGEELLGPKTLELLEGLSSPVGSEAEPFDEKPGTTAKGGEEQ
jgi:hypothetical protein